MSEEIVEIIKCPKCGQDKPADTRNKHMCVDCVRAENNRYSHLRKNQGDWMEVAKDAGLDVWLQQPGETQLEYAVWVAYRDSYPGKKPSFREAAEKAGTTLEFVRTVSQRWTFQARMQAWMTECDRITMEQRRAEILHMNKEHVDMAQRLRDKMSEAIDRIDPTQLKPSDLGSLMKLATELERKAQLDMADQESKQRDLVVDNENPNIRSSPTKHGDLAEVAQILLNAGALGSITQIGIRETTTREIVAKED